VIDEHQREKIKAILDALVLRADNHGYITMDDLIEFFPNKKDKQVLSQEIILYLHDQGVDILDSEPVTNNFDNILDGEAEIVSDIDSLEDNVELYLKEMSRVPLLSMAEEQEIAKRIERGRAAKIELSMTDLEGQPERAVELRLLINDGDNAWEHLIKANTRLVVSIAKRYIGRGVPFLDLIQEGNLGLIKAVEKFDYHRGFRFSTYATWWIRQSITRSVALQGRTIRIPVHMIDRIRELYKVHQELELSLGRKPLAKELAEKLNLSVSKVQWIMRVSWLPLSLDTPVGEDEESDLGMFVEDQETPSPIEVTFQTMMRDKINEVLATLTPREARILRMRYGLDGGKGYTLEEVGLKFGLTRERIRQIEGKALRQLRHPYKARELKEYL